MDTEKLNLVESAAAGLVARCQFEEALKIEGIFTCECIGKDGKVKWTDTFKNVVTDQGKKDILDKYLGLGAAGAGIAMGLHTTVGTSTSTYATPTPQVEASSGVIAARLAPSFSAASGAGSVTKSTSAAVSFPVIGSATIAGCFVVEGGSGILTSGNTAAVGGVLVSSGAFSGGSRAVQNGDALNVTYSLGL
jgi:hypothetical protein